MASITDYIVKAGDTLFEIAEQFGTTVSELVKKNNITDPDYIVVGQELVIDGDGKTATKNLSQKATIKVFGLQADTDRTVYATWDWDRDDETKHYEVKWMYGTGDDVGFIGNKSTTEDKQSLYTAPSNATHVAFYVTPISKTYKNNDKEVSYWTASESTRVAYYFKDNPPSTPPVPTVEIKDYTLTAKLANLDVNGSYIEFQVVKDDASSFSKGVAVIDTSAAAYSCTVTAGHEYKVRCRAYRSMGTDEELKSDWSDYSDNVTTKPASPNSILELRALTETSVYMDWSKVSNADSYEIEYATKKSRFDSSTETQTMSVESVVSHAEVTGLDSGEEWFFRVRAVNDQGNSDWTAIKSVKLGTAPASPTTWSSTTTVVVGESLTFYWIHNSEDGSSQTYGQLELTIGGTTTTTTIKNSTDEDEKDKTSFYSLSTSGYTEGTTIQWRVRTRGVMEEYGEWSIQRTVDVYAPPTLEFGVNDSNGDSISELTAFPFYVSAVAGPNTQSPIGYHVVVKANETYETVDSVGNRKVVSSGEEVYSEYFDISSSLLMEFSANNINLDNNISYTVVCTVTMNSGLTAEASSTLTVLWTDDTYWPNAEIAYDPETYTTFVRPYCRDENGANIEGVTLSLYRREFDGSFTELGTGIDNTSNIFITDPHPALDYARYRVVAISDATGSVSFYDVPGYPVGEIAAIIQWDENWTTFDTTNEDALEQPVWSGSLLRLPYNIDVSDSNSSDVSLVEYIGRKHPVSYYGTQLGMTSSWKVEIEKSDKETLYALRRLAMWMGDVYVREPSGSGYWANVSVSFSQTHCKLTIPVTLDITRVAGGV